jgi:hypothetical protein
MSAGRQLLQTLVAAGLVVLTACSGGGGGAGYTITGVAASGAAISQGILDVHCQQGSASAVTALDGSYSVTIAGGQGPCILRASQPATGLVLHSLVEGGASSANITPVTELILAMSGKHTHSLVDGNDALGMLPNLCLPEVGCSFYV